MTQNKGTEPVLVRFGSWTLAVTLDINCKADETYPHKNKKDFVTFTKENFENSERQVTGPNAKILSY